MYGITDEMVAMQLKEAIEKLTSMAHYVELKHRGENGWGNKLTRGPYWYGYAEADIEDEENEPGYLHIEADHTELSVVLHGLIQEIEQGGPHADKRTGYAYLKF